MFWFVVVPLMAAAIHLALLCLVWFTMMSYPKGVGSPPWAEPLLMFLAWPFPFFAFNPTTLWIGIVLTFLWTPAIALGAVKVCMLLKKRDTEQSAAPLPSAPAGTSEGAR
jgi:hypothetical protein